MRLQYVLAVVALCVTSCEPPGEPTTEDTSSTQSPIVGGSLTSGDPAVVMVGVRGGGGYASVCTGTLVGPKTIVTAAHCIYAYGQGASYAALFGPSETTWTKAVPIISQTQHPNYAGSRGEAYDFGVLQLSRAVLDVTPIEMNPTPLEGYVGQPVRHVGYGITVGGGQDSGDKRQVTYNVRGVERLKFESGAPGKQTCQGDSGGPAFMVTTGSTAERLAGVVSYGDQYCQAFGYDGRIDVVLPWIRRTMSAWETPTCATDGLCKTGCTPIDQDCACAADGQCTADCLDVSTDADCPKDCAGNGVCATQSCPRPDVDCIAVGDGCRAAISCQQRVCVADKQNTQPYCSLPCTQNSTCPSGMECSGGRCLKLPRPERQLNDSCFQNSDFCVASICAGPSDGITRCVRACDSSADCGGAGDCQGGADGVRFCRPPGLSFSKIILPALQSVEGAAAAGCNSVGAGPLLLAALSLLLRRRRR